MRTLVTDGFFVQIFSLTADNDIIVCGLLNGLAHVYCVATQRLITVLDCQSSGVMVRLSLDRDHIAASSSHGVISVWERADYSLVLRDSLSHAGADVRGLTILRGLLVTGDDGGQLSVFRVDKDNVRRIRAEVNKKLPINHIDFDGCWILTGSVSALKIIHMSGGSSKRLKTGYIECCSLLYPLAATSGMKYSRGIKIWDLESGRLLTTVCDALVFRSLDRGPRGVLAAATSPSSQQTPSAIYLIDTRHLRTNDTCPMPRVRRMAGSDEPTVLDPAICLTDTKLVEAHGTRLTFREFWYYQVSDWELDTFLSDVLV